MSIEVRETSKERMFRLSTKGEDAPRLWQEGLLSESELRELVEKGTDALGDEPCCSHGKRGSCCAEISRLRGWLEKIKGEYYDFTRAGTWAKRALEGAEVPR